MSQVENNLFIVGAQKAGTTALHHYLEQHPLITSGVSKESGFFHKDSLFQRGEGYYRSLFPVDMKGKYALDSTPEYLYLEKAAERIHKFKPDAKIIILLREPVSRAYSAFNMYSQGFGSKLFRHALKNSNHDAKKIFLPIAEGKKLPEIEQFLALEMDIIAGNTSGAEPSLIRRGIYTPQIERYINIFGQDNVLILFSSDLKGDTSGTVDRVLEFAGLPKIYMGEHLPKHVREYTTESFAKERIRQVAGHLFDMDRQALQERLHLNVPW